LKKKGLLFQQGIKTLSLFFIDEVANYKSYDENNEEVHGPLWKMFEEEYTRYLNENLSLFDDAYQKYLRRDSVDKVHNGYFSIDKKGHAIDSTMGRGEDTSNDISAYDLILKNKERLLSFDEPTRLYFPILLCAKDGIILMYSRFAHYATPIQQQPSDKK
jgi:type III restriction enzyme